MSDLSEFKRRLDESAVRIACEASTKIHSECNRRIAELEQRLAAAEALLREAVEALQALYDYQNGCPLPTYRVGWTAAMVAAENVLRDADKRLEKQIAAKEVSGE